MKKLLVFVSLLFLLFVGYCQELIYTISATDSGQATHLDSILFENLSNHTGFVVKNLPVLPAYEVDLSSQLLVSAVEAWSDPLESSFRLIRNAPGEAVVLYSGKTVANARLIVYGLGGQQVLNRMLPVLIRHDLIHIVLPASGLYILSLQTPKNIQNFKVVGSVACQRGAYSISLAQIPQKHDGVAYVETQSHVIQKDAGFFYQIGDSIRITPFLNGYYTFPQISRISRPRTFGFDMLRSTVDSTGISDAYAPLAEGTYVVVAYDTITGGTRLSLTPDAIEMQPGHIIIVDLDTTGVIQKVVSLQEKDGETFVHTIPAYMDELFVNKMCKLDSRIKKPKIPLNNEASPEVIIEALTNENGYMHPVKVVFWGPDQTTATWSVFDDEQPK